jgi:deoxyribodipyrimidine photo-lyase
MDANRVLILEPSHFKKFPVSDKVISFIIKLAREIKGLQIFVGEIDQLLHQRSFPVIHSKVHPSFVHFPGSKDEPDWMFPSVIPRGSFTSYFKACEKIMNQHS